MKDNWKLGFTVFFKEFLKGSFKGMLDLCLCLG